jgi:carotenoid cleavage dioxygenase-like enzyme
MPDFEAIFQTPEEAHPQELTVTSGSVPCDLRGALLRNGPGRQRAGETPLHFLDGYAFVAQARFTEGRVQYCARHVDLPIARREAAASQLLKRRIFTNRPGGRWANILRLLPSTSASHDVYAWGGSVVVADIDGYFMLDPTTLDTRGPSPLNRLLGPLTTLSAMPRVDPFSGRLVVYTATPGIVGHDRIAVVEVDDEWNEHARVERTLGMKGAVPHDLVTTQNHYLIVQLGQLSVPQAAAGGLTIIEAISVSSGGSRILVLPRRGDGPVRSLPLPEGCQSFHVANAYEENGLLVIDTALHEGLVDFSPLFPPAAHVERRSTGRGSEGPFLARHTLRLDNGEHNVVVHRDARGEVPHVRDDRSGRRHRFAYTSVQGERGDEPVDNAYY